MESTPPRPVPLTQTAHQLIEQVVATARAHAPHRPLLAIDATAGNGHDTLFLARLLGSGSTVAAFDIQAQALANTAARLHQASEAEAASPHVEMCSAHSQAKRQTKLAANEQEALQTQPEAEAASPHVGMCSAHSQTQRQTKLTANEQKALQTQPEAEATSPHVGMCSAHSQAKRQTKLAANEQEALQTQPEAEAASPHVEMCSAHSQAKRQTKLAAVQLVQASHADMLARLPTQWQGAACVITFNLGYLPGGDKTRTTVTESTLPALEAALQLLAPGGLLSVLCYRGHPEGATETNAINNWLTHLPATFSSSITLATGNAPAHAPMLLSIRRTR